jgi:endonuclease/exonuclease/phosphatase family metal-dependent hydrolase
LLLTALSGGGLGGAYLDDMPWLAPAVEAVATASQSAGAGQQGNGAFAQVIQEIGQVAQQRLATTSTSAASSAGPVVRTVPAQFSAAQRPPDRIYIATFNIQVFGKSKMSEPWVVEVLAQTVRHCDIVAIQEVRAKEDDILPRFVAAINADGSRYDYLIGPRLGRTVSTEQYAFVYDTARVEYDPSSVGTMSDPSDELHREPFVARFRSRTVPPQQAFSFWLVNTHTDPDEVPQEVAALANAFLAMQRARGDEDDVILLGDLNASETQLGPLGKIPRMNWVVRGATTNTRQTKAYDNILFDGWTTSEYTGRWGVYDLERAFGLTREQALKVSDHLPVWAEFSAWELNGPANFARQSGAGAPR